MASPSQLDDYLGALEVNLTGEQAARLTAVSAVPLGVLTKRWPERTGIMEAYERERTGLLLVDPYNDFLSEGGKLWPFVKEVAETTSRFAIELGYHVTLVKDATAAFTREMMRAAHELNGPTFAHEILTTAELVAALPKSRWGSRGGSPTAPTGRA